MWMRVGQTFVPVLMRMALARLEPRGMVVAMMLVMLVLVRVLEGLVRMPVRVPLGEMQPHAPRHQHRGDGESRRNGLVQQREAQRSAGERRGRKIGAGTRGTELTQSPHEERQADPIACESE